MALSSNVSVTVSGTPAAVLVEVPKLDLMSWRTTPDASSTFGPLEPSPGKGPAVSCGISTPHSAIARVSVGVADGEDAVVAAAADVVGADAADVPAPGADVELPLVPARAQRHCLRAHGRLPSRSRSVATLALPR